MCLFYQVKIKYNLNKEQFLDILQKQLNKCPICNDPISFDDNAKSYSNIAVDHCHDTGIVRGIVHSICNISYIGANTKETAKRLVKYLERNEDRYE